MKKIKLSTNITLNTVAIYIALFCVATYALMEHVSTTISAFSVVKMPLMYLGGLCVLTQIKMISRVLLRKNYFYMLLALTVMCMLLLTTVLFNRNTTIGDSPAMHTLRLIFYLYELFLVMILLAETGRGRAALNFLFWYVLVLVVANDVLMFTRIMTFRSGKFENYLVGTKFSVSYRHLNLLTLWAIRSNRGLIGWKKRASKVFTVAATGYIVLVAVRVDCMTGILGGLALMVLLGVMNSPRRNKLLRFTASGVLLTAMVLSVVFAFIAEGIMEIPFVRYVVEEVLSRDTTITGRTNIYDMYINNMEGRWLAGYGFGNGNDAAVTLFGYENVQNGLLQWVLQVGVPTTVALVAVLLTVFRQIKRRNPKNMDKILPLTAMIYVYIILGTIETTFDMAFLMWFAMIFMLVNEKQPIIRNGNPAPVTGMAVRQA